MVLGAEVSPGPSETTPAALRPPPGNPRFAALDGIRGLAALAIVVFHAGSVSAYNLLGRFGRFTGHLDVAVSVFFVLSGFLLYRPFVLARANGTARPGALRFYRRRLFRIVPAYWAALLILTVLPGMTKINPGLAPLHGSGWPVYYGFLQIYQVSTATHGLGQAWSLCVEMSFYAMLPLLALVAAATGSTRREIGLLLALAAASTLARVWSYDVGNPYPLALTIAGTFAWLAAGMVLAVASVEVQLRPRLRSIPVLPCWAAAAAIYVIAVWTFLPRDVASQLTAGEALAVHLTYLAVAVLVMLPLCIGTPRGLLARLATSKPARWLGLVSYGVFLWHIQAVLFANAHLATAGGVRHKMWIDCSFALITAIALGALSYGCVERFALRFKG